MKPLSDKFANLGRPGIERRVAVEPSRALPLQQGGSVRKERKTNPAQAVKRARAKNDKYRDYQRDYMRKHRAKLSTP